MLTECRKIYTVARACSATCNNGPLIIRDSPAPLLACKLRKSSNAALHRVQANIRESRKMTERDRTNRTSCNSKEKKTKKKSTKKRGEVEWNNEEHEEVEE